MTPPSPSIPGGCVLLARKMLDSDLMDQSPLVVKLWVWLLLKANWKDRDQLRRGQLMTSIAEMQEALSYFAGWRKMMPTKDEVRTAYEALSKATRITTRRTTRGMVITIVNFDIYQDLSLYGAHTENHKETATKPTATPHDTEVREEEKKGNEENPSPRSLFDLWNTSVDGSPLSRARDFTKDREQKCKSRLKERSLSEWRDIFRRCASIPFLCGEKDGGWKANFDWIIKNAKNGTKVIEGHYGEPKAHVNSSPPLPSYMTDSAFDDVEERHAAA